MTKFLWTAVLVPEAMRRTRKDPIVGAFVPAELSRRVKPPKLE